MLSAMGTSMTLPIAQLPQISLFFFMGVVLFFDCGDHHKIIRYSSEQVIETTTLKERFHQDPLVIIDSVFL